MNREVYINKWGIKLLIQLPIPIYRNMYFFRLVINKIEIIYLRIGINGGDTYFNLFNKSLYRSK